MENRLHDSPPRTELIPSPEAVPARVALREIIGWCSGDVAGSAFTMVITTVVYARYFHEVVAQDSASAPMLWGVALAASQLALLLTAPFVGALADFSGRKKTLLAAAFAVCALGTAGLAFTGAGQVPLAMALVFTANLAFWLADSLRCSFLPDISTPETAARISGFGWTAGYAGGIAALVLVLFLFQQREGQTPAAFTLTAIFYALFSLPLFFLRASRNRLALTVSHDAHASAAVPANTSASWREHCAQALRSNLGLFAELRNWPQAKAFFLTSYFYIPALMATIAYSAVYAEQVLHMGEKETLLLFICLQLAAGLGAFATGMLADSTTATPDDVAKPRVQGRLRKPRVTTLLMGSFILWAIVCAVAAASRTNVTFWVAAIGAGLAVGIVSNAERTIISLLSPEGRSGEFFGLWGTISTIGCLVGYLLFGVVASFAGFRIAMLMNVVLFVGACIALRRVKLEKRS